MHFICCCRWPLLEEKKHASGLVPWQKTSSAACSHGPAWPRSIRAEHIEQKPTMRMNPSRITRTFCECRSSDALSRTNSITPRQQHCTVPAPGTNAGCLWGNFFPQSLAMILWFSVTRRIAEACKRLAASTQTPACAFFFLLCGGRQRPHYEFVLLCAMWH